MKLEYLEQSAGVLELPKDYTAVSELLSDSVARRMRAFLLNYGLRPLKTRNQLTDLKLGALIYAVIDGTRGKVGLEEYLIAGYIAQKGDFELSQYLSKQQLATNYPMTLEHPRGALYWSKI